MDSSALYQAQELVYMHIVEILGDKACSGVKLCGGTALSRCYLRHRVSYDLDFFVNPKMSLMEEIQKKLNGMKEFRQTRNISGQGIYSQLFGHIFRGGFAIQTSFVEDRWFDAYPSVERTIGDVVVVTEPIEGLYHKKLRTVAGVGIGAEGLPVGCRQTLRDIFDLVVLSRTVRPLPEFLSALPMFPDDAFYAGLCSMNWYGLLNDVELEVSPEWRHLLPLEQLIDAIYAEADLQPVSEAEDADNSPTF
jgi:hypothetical protein